MAHITADRVKDTSTTTGTGAVTVSGTAPSPFRTFSAVATTSDTFYYCIEHQTANEWEVGLGTYSAANEITRTTVRASSNAGSAVSFSAGTKSVMLVHAAAALYATVIGGASAAAATVTTLGCGAITSTGLLTVSLAGNSARLLNTTDNASVQVARLEGDRATMADNDEAYVSLMLSNDGGTQTEFGRLTWVATDVNAATSVDGRLDFAVVTAGSLADEMQLDGTALAPSANDGLQLGTTALGFADLHLATGAVINFANGNYTLTHSSAVLTLSGKLNLAGTGEGTGIELTGGSGGIRSDGPGDFTFFGTSNGFWIESGDCNIGGGNLNAAGGVLSSSSTIGIGYSTGAGGAVTQITSKATGVTIDNVCGQITMHNAALAAAAEVSFTVTNSACATTDCVVVNHDSVGTGGAYCVHAHSIGAGSFAIMVGNMSTGSLSEAIVLNFAIVKAVAA